MARTTATLRNLWAPACGDAPLDTVALWTGVRVTIRTPTRDAWRAFDLTLQAHGYRPLSGQTGAYNCRAISGGTSLSLHAYGIALDLNWHANPYRTDGRLVTDYPSAMIRDLEGIRTRGGARVFAWGGRWSSPVDAMHWQIDASPSEIATGIDWTTVAMPALDPGRPGTWPVLEDGDRGPTVEELQVRLNGAGARLETDGVFGPNTLAAVEEFQRSRRLTVDGIVGTQTWTALLTGSPVDPDVPPSKIPTPGGPFPDVPADHTFATEIGRARDLEILAGYSDGTFRPGAPLTRAAAAALVARLIDALEIDAG